MSLSVYSQKRCSSPFIILMALHWTLSSMSISVLYCEAQNWTQYSRCGLTCTEQRGRITSLNLLTTLIFMQLRIPLAFFAPVQPGVHQDTQVLLCQAAFQFADAQHILVPGVVPSHMKDFALPLTELHEVLLSAHLSSLFRSLWIAA